MNLLTVKLLAGARALAARPAWLAGAAVMLTAVCYGGYRLTRHAVEWLYAYPLITTIAPVIVKRSLEGFFLVLMAAALFSVLVASVGTLYGADDLELLLAQPVSGARVFALKVAELFVNAAALPVAFVLPVLAGVGAALGAPPSYYAVAPLAAAALFALPVTLGALLALVLVRFSPPGRVKEIATAASVIVAAAAVAGLRALRPEQLTRVTAADEAAFEAFLQTFARLDLGWMPPAWAANAAWAALDGRPHASLAALLAVAAAGLVTVAALARRAYRRGWVRSLDAAPAPKARPAKPAPAWERALTARLGPLGAAVAKDARVYLRDAQQWSQTLILLALGGAYFLSLASVPVPTREFRDLIGALNVAFVSFLVAGVSLRAAYPLVSLEGKAVWLARVQPLRARDLVVGKFLFALPPTLALAVALGAGAARALEVSSVLAVCAPFAAACSALAMTGLAVGLGAAHPRFDHSHPNELALTPGAVAYMALAVAYSASTAYLLARPALRAVTAAAAPAYWRTVEGAAALGGVAALSAAAAALALAYGVRQLSGREGAW